VGQRPVFFAELGHALQKSVVAAIGKDLVPAAQSGQHALARLAVFAIGLSDLEVLVEDAVLEATFEPNKYTDIMSDLRHLLRGYFSRTAVNLRT
jgi:hypothetical protein